MQHGQECQEMLSADQNSVSLWTETHKYLISIESVDLPVNAPMCCVMPPASPAATEVFLSESNSVVLPWSTWPITATIGGRGTRLLDLAVFSIVLCLLTEFLLLTLAFPVFNVELCLLTELFLFVLAFPLPWFLAGLEVCKNRIQLTIVQENNFCWILKQLAIKISVE